MKKIILTIATILCISITTTSCQDRITVKEATISKTGTTILVRCKSNFNPEASKKYLVYSISSDAKDNHFTTKGDWYVSGNNIHSSNNMFISDKEIDTTLVQEYYTNRRDGKTDTIKCNVKYTYREVVFEDKEKK